MVVHATVLLRNLCDAARAHTGRPFKASEFTTDGLSVEGDISDEGAAIIFDAYLDTSAEHPRWLVHDWFQVACDEREARVPGYWCHHYLWDREEEADSPDSALRALHERLVDARNELSRISPEQINGYDHDRVEPPTP
jgi:hypothetical protein